ncbi:MAG: phosphatidate cytidylyltransferase [Proteobacteria bacterium]|nr:phosphatidate cytidylyltransferase [Pseudomonadota bacterium]
MSRELFQRILSALTLALLAIICLYFVNELIFLTVTILLISVCIFEYLKALKKKKIALQPVILYTSVFMLFTTYWYVRTSLSEYYLQALAIAFVPIIVGSLFSKAPFIITAFWYLIPLLWIVLPLNFLAILRSEGYNHQGANMIVFLVVVVAFNDIFAYFGGKRFGRHKLAPSISPKKTVEGTMFGYIGALTGGYFVGYYFAGFQFNLSLFVIILLVTLAAQIGDLVESKFKRYCQIKDSSNLIPGHGGFLDRFDAILIALPVFWQLKSSIGITYI